MFCSECRGRDGCQLCGEPWYYSYENGPQVDEMADEMDSDEMDSDETGLDEEPQKRHIIRVEKRYTPLACFGELLLKDPRANGAHVIAHNGDSK
ncbi:hypothetical protein B9Z55_015434 [Caenorhabditis nigoni]|uniref:Uncharacterized protein n=1 Tax=Caenorhabditis nigoni TaxID=1611254 RepID=A0A2G5UAZ4_9PELO|nr:hypothetical protein B9Z55_015434 [Caenorhabditis nigoni]